MPSGDIIECEDMPSKFESVPYEPDKYEGYKIGFYNDHEDFDSNHGKMELYKLPKYDNYRRNPENNESPLTIIPAGTYGLLDKRFGHRNEIEKLLSHLKNDKNVINVDEVEDSRDVLELKRAILFGTKVEPAREPYLEDVGLTLNCKPPDFCSFGSQ